MKTYRNLYCRVKDFDNLVLAAQKAHRRKRWKSGVLEFERNLEENLWQINKELGNGDWMPSSGNRFLILRPKKRWITAAPYGDRVVHHALCNVIEPILDARFIHHSYACRTNRGTHAAQDCCQRFLRRNTYGLKCDIRSYFPSIDHEILMEQLKARFKDSKLLEILRRVVDQYNELNQDYAVASARELVYFPGDDLFTPLERRRGLPIGNLTSQVFANLYLSSMDHFIKTELHCKDYLRYMDDFVLFANYKSRLTEWKAELVKFLNSIRLNLHRRKTQVFRTVDGLPFLGFHLYPRRRRVLSYNLRAFKHRFRHSREDYFAGRITLDQVNQRVRAWIGHVSHADSYRLRRSILYNCII